MSAESKHYKIAGQLFAELGSSFLPDAIKEVLEQKKCRFFVACSGGVDSIFLLYWVYEYIKRRNSLASLEALHFNHCLRGDAANGDEQFVREVCQEMAIPLQTARWTRTKSSTQVSEAEARTARFRFFQSACRNVENPIILTGHHGSDVVETMLMRLSRGSGSVGLSAPRPISDPGLGFSVCRPLLRLSHSTIRATMTQLGADWREDASNQSNDFYRNRVRNSVIPAWETASDRELLPGILMARDRFEEDSNALERWLDSLWSELVVEGGSFDLERFSRIEPALQRRAVDRLLNQSECNATFSSTHWSILQKALEKGENSVISLSDTVRLLLEHSKNKLSIENETKSVDWNLFNLPIQQLAYLPDGSLVKANIVKMETSLLNSVRRGEFSHATTVFLNVKHPLAVSVRTWRYGDNYRPHGLEKCKKVSKLFIDRKVPLDLRSRLPFFISNRDQILWAPHLPPNQSYLVDHNTTHALQLSYKPCDGVS